MHTARVFTILVLSLSPLYAALPEAPRNGKNSVQMLVGGTNKIPMCIVPPRTRADGTAIPPGTPCTIVVYRSFEQGKRDSYNTEVGRAAGKVTKPDDLQAWIDLTAVVPPEDPRGGVFYLASSAIIDGQESDLNSQWLTVRWAPGEFTPVEYPAASRIAGAPPSRRAAMIPVGPLAYPDWVKPSGGESFDWALPRVCGLGCAPVIRFRVTGATVTGDLLAAPLVTALTKATPGAQVTFPRSRFEATVDKGLLVGRLALTVALKGVRDKKPVSDRVDTDVEVRGALGPSGSIQGGSGTGQVVEALTGKPVATSAYPGLFTARPSDPNRPATLDTTNSTQAALGAPGPSFKLPAYASDRLFGIGGRFVHALKETLKLHRGDTKLLNHTDVPNAVVTGAGLSKLQSSVTRFPGDTVDWFCGPDSVLSSERIGDGMKIRAVANGVGEVWSRSKWTYKAQDGTTREGTQFITWLVLVGADAAEAYDASKGVRTGTPLAADPGPVSSGRVTGYVRGPDGNALPGATIFLVFEATGKTYQSESWVSGADGKFNLDLAKESSRNGLKEGSYQVMPFKRRPTNEAGPSGDYWPHPRTRRVITITRDAAVAGPIAVPGEIWMDLTGRLFGD